MHSFMSRRAFANLRLVGCGRLSWPAFSTSSRHLKKVPARSPTVRANERARQQGLPPSRQSEKWPMHLLEVLAAVSNSSPRAADERSLTLEDLVAILNDFDALGLAMAKMQAKHICSEHRIGPKTLFRLGYFLLNFNDVKYRDVATTLLVCAVDSGIGLAAQRLLTDAMLTGRQKGPGVAAARKLIQEYALDGSPGDVYYEGKMLEYEGKSLEALHHYQTGLNSINQLREAPGFEGHYPEVADVCKALARLRAKLGDRNGAEEAIRDAALMYDDPAAYYHLALDFTAPDSAEFERYLLKAASSDEAKASHELGMFYFGQSRQGIALHTIDLEKTVTNTNAFEDRGTQSKLPGGQHLSQEAMLEKRAEAMEWFSIGAESGITASQVYLAILLREAGRADEGFGWLQSATESADADDWAEAIDYFKRMWRLRSPNPMRMDLESLRKSSKNAMGEPISRPASSLNDATFWTDIYHNMKKVDQQWELDDRVYREYSERGPASW